ncbi:MAG: Crp/Fnr family transcriptional regulator [Rhodospirillales bacterium]|nr:Crp/Fnr family transcriptional regulator [Rhodospirillales bacterium]
MAEIKTLSKVELFSDLNNSNLKQYNDLCRWKYYNPNDTIIEQTDETNDVYFIIEGQVRVSNVSSSGKEVTLEILDTGQCFGELAAIDNSPRSSNVSALEHTFVAIMQSNIFLKAIEDNPSIAVKLIAMMASVIRTSSERIVNLVTLGANDRVLAELLHELKICKIVNNSAIIECLPLQQDIANKASTTRETVARVFSDLAKKGIILRNKRTLMVTDVTALKKLYSKDCEYQ